MALAICVILIVIVLVAAAGFYFSRKRDEHWYGVLALSSPAGDAIIGQAPYVAAATQIDPHVFESLDRWVVHAHAGNSWDISSYVREHHSTIFAANHGFIDGLKGYVAESIVADHFTALGHNVVMATTTNQPGWDLTIDGHFFQVKSGVTAARAAHDALSIHPEIPIITDPDAANHLLNLDPHAVLAVHDIAPHHLQSLTTTSLHATDLLSHAGSAHLPFITIAMSSWRELSLLKQGHTELTTAVSHVVVDTAGVGIGMAAGAKGGAAIGGLTRHPIGMGIGALVGGIGGAVAGKLVAMFAKERELRRLVKAYGEELGQAELLFDGRVRQAQSETIAALNAIGRRDKASRRAHSSDLKLSSKRLRGALRHSRRAMKRVGVSPIPSANGGSVPLGRTEDLMGLAMAADAAPAAESEMHSRITAHLRLYAIATTKLQSSIYEYQELICSLDQRTRALAGSVLTDLASVAEDIYAEATRLANATRSEMLRLGKAKS